MRLVTWNLAGLNDTAVDERTEAAVFTSTVGARLDQLHAGVKATRPPDVIVFQEVVGGRAQSIDHIQHILDGRI